jgi:hypothetical protein
MAAISLRDRFGKPQIFAGLLLLVFLAQCCWLTSACSTRDLEGNVIDAVREGAAQWHGGPMTLDATHSPLWFLLLSFPAALLGVAEASPLFPLAAAAPQIIFGLLLGASLWYVARRLFGNAGGYIALALYCFSPGILRASTLWFAEPEMPAAWGAFGAVFTAIAVSHTLYAPREVVLWNWRRILLLGLSFALAVGCQFSLAVLVALALFFMLYLAWDRRAAVVVIWLAACVVAVVLLAAVYGFRPHLMLAGFRNAILLPLQWRAYITPLAYRAALARISEISPALLLAFPSALLTYLLWPRTRYFGNTAPLLLSFLLLALGIGNPHLAGFGFYLVAIPFLFVFVAGIAADLLETRHRALALVCIAALLLANAAWNLRGLFISTRLFSIN